MPNTIINTLASFLTVTVINQLWGYNVTQEYVSPVVNSASDAISDIYENIVGEARPPPEPLDIRDFSEDLHFNKDPNVNIDNLTASLNLMKLAKMENVKACELYENVDHKTLHRIIDLIGANDTLSSDQIELMKLSTGANRVIRYPKQ